MASLTWWLSVALCAGLGRAVAADSSSTSSDVTCTDTTASTNLLSNPSWENGLGPWSYVYPRTVSTAQASDGSQSLLTSGVYPFQTIFQTITGLVPGTTYQASVDWMVVISNTAITEQCTFYLYHDSLATANIIDASIASHNRNSNKWATLSGPFTATKESVMFGIYFTCSPYRISQVEIYIDNAKFILETTTQACTTATPTLTLTSTLPASMASSQSSSSVSSMTSSAPIAHSSSAILTTTSTPALQSSSPVSPSSVPSQTPSASTPVLQSSSPLASMTASSPNTHSSSAILTPTSTSALQSSSPVSPPSVPSQTPSASTPVPQSSTMASSVVSSSSISHSSSSASTSPSSSPMDHPSSNPLPPTSTPLVHSSSSFTQSSVPLTSTPAESHTSASSVPSRSIEHSSSSVIPSASLSVPTVSTSIAATASTGISTGLQSTSPIPSTSGTSTPSTSTISFVPSSSSTVTPLSTAVSATEPNQQLSHTGVLNTDSAPSSPVGFSATTSSGQVTATNVALTTSTIYSTRVSTITACPSSVVNCPAQSRTTHVITDTIYVSTTVCPVAEGEPTAHLTTELQAASTTTFVVSEKVPSPPTGIPVISVSVSPIFSSRTVTITSCPPKVTGCSADSGAPQVVTETLLIGESTHTLSGTAPAIRTTQAQIGSTSSVPVSYTTQTVSSSAAEHVKTSGSKTTLAVSTTVPISSISTGTTNLPAFNGAESLGHSWSFAQVIIPVTITGFVLLWL